MTRSGPAPADTGNRAQDAAATQLHNASPKGSVEAGREAWQRKLRGLVRQVIDGDGPPLDRLRTAARRGQELIAAGGQRVALSAALTAAAVAAGVARRTTKNAITAALWGVR